MTIVLMVLPTFSSPVCLRLDELRQRSELLSLLRLEKAEFLAVLGQPVVYEPIAETGHVWDVVIDPSAPHVSLEAVTGGLMTTLPHEDDVTVGIDLLYSLAHSKGPSVSDTEACGYPEAFDRIVAELGNIYPYFELRGLHWDDIVDRHHYVRDLEGAGFWDGAALLVAALGDAHTQLIPRGMVRHPPYRAEMNGDGARLLKVPDHSAAADAGVVEGDLIEVDDPKRWLRAVGASPQQWTEVAARRFLSMRQGEREFTAITRSGARARWTEHVVRSPSVTWNGNRVVINFFASDVPDLLQKAIHSADPAAPLTIDLRGNTGGNLVSAARTRRLLVRGPAVFGSVQFSTGRHSLASPQVLHVAPAAEPWTGRVRLLVDSMTYSAAEDFIHPLVGLPHVTIVGGPTGGGSGRPHTRLIKDGVKLATSTAITYTRHSEPIEFYGITG